jgi:hypothetical protein
MRETIAVLNRMESDGVIGRYCITGAVAALHYVEATATEDIDILVSFAEMEVQPGSGLLTLAPIVKYLSQQGYTEFHKEGLLIEGWPVQFLPVANALDAEALESAEYVVIDSPSGEVRVRVLRPEYIVANALRVGRPKDRNRVIQFLEEDVIEPRSLCALLDRHGLRPALSALCRSIGLVDPCML